MNHRLGQLVSVGGLSVNSVVRRPFESLETDVSRKGIVLSFSISMVKRIVGC